MDQEANHKALKIFYERFKNAVLQQKLFFSQTLLFSNLRLLEKVMFFTTPSSVLDFTKKWFLRSINSSTAVFNDFE